MKAAAIGWTCPICGERIETDLRVEAANRTIHIEGGDAALAGPYLHVWQHEREVMV